MVRIFFIQHGLYNIINGIELDSAGEVLPKNFDGIAQLADRSILYCGSGPGP